LRVATFYELTDILGKNLHPDYIEGFSDAGHHISKSTKQLIPGSPLNALTVTPAFEHYYLVEKNEARAAELRRVAGEKRNVYVYGGDCNHILVSDVFPKIQYKEFRRALCILDPYGLHLNGYIHRAE
jgi:three-Cys-motif partner protein